MAAQTDPMASFFAQRRAMEEARKAKEKAAKEKAAREKAAKGVKPAPVPVQPTSPAPVQTTPPVTSYDSTTATRPNPGGRRGSGIDPNGPTKSDEAFAKQRQWGLQQMLLQHLAELDREDRAEERRRKRERIIKGRTTIDGATGNHTSISMSRPRWGNNGNNGGDGDNGGGNPPSRFMDAITKILNPGGSNGSGQPFGPAPKANPVQMPQPPKVNPVPMLQPPKANPVQMPGVPLPRPDMSWRFRTPADGKTQTPPAKSPVDESVSVGTHANTQTDSTGTSLYLKDSNRIIFAQPGQLPKAVNDASRYKLRRLYS